MAIPDGIPTFIDEEGKEQPLPIHNDLPAAWDLVMADMGARDRMGAARYGSRLQPHNGRDALRDAYEEILDAAVYLRSVIYERDGK
jgi:hypothetical protein